jgi:hypothetical protein
LKNIFDHQNKYLFCVFGIVMHDVFLKYFLFENISK